MPGENSGSLKSAGPQEGGGSVTGSDVFFPRHWFQVQAGVPGAGGLAAAKLRLATAVLQLPAGRADPPTVR